MIFAVFTAAWLFSAPMPAVAEEAFDEATIGQATAEIRRLREPWLFLEVHRFGILETFKHGQGLATDGRTFWYSSKQRIIKAPSVYAAPTLDVDDAIPEELRKLGCNHIGDIDYDGGNIYAGVEDGPSYKMNFVAVFDAETLRLKATHRLPTEQQRDGVPWVAVDAAANRLLSSEFDAAQITAYDLDTMRPLPPIKLAKPISRIQGAKVFRRKMYLTSDGRTEKAVYSVDLNNGDVEKLFTMPPTTLELEGLALLVKPDGLHLFILSVDKPTGATYLSTRTEITHLKVPL